MKVTESAVDKAAQQVRQRVVKAASIWMSCNFCGSSWFEVLKHATEWRLNIHDPCSKGDRVFTAREANPIEEQSGGAYDGLIFEELSLVHKLD